MPSIFSSPERRDLAGRVHRLAEFLGAEPAEVVVHLERQTEVVHLLVAGPAVRLLRHTHAVAEGALRVVRQLRVDRDRQVGDVVAEQLLAHPLAAQDRVVVEVGGMGDQPARLREDAGPLLLRQFHRLLGLPYGHVVRGARRALIAAGRAALHRRLLLTVVSVSHEALVGGEQLVQHVLVLIQNVLHEAVGVADQDARVVVLVQLLVLEHLGRHVVLEVFVEEAEQARLGELGFGPQPLDLGSDLRGRLEFTLVGGGEQLVVRPAVADGVGEGERQLARGEPHEAVLVRRAGAALGAEQRLRVEQDRGEGGAHALGAPGVSDVLLEQGDEPRGFVFRRRALEGELELPADGLLEVGPRRRAVGVEQRAELLDRAVLNLQFAVGAGGKLRLLGDDGLRVADELRGGRLVDAGVGGVVLEPVVGGHRERHREAALAEVGLHPADGILVDGRADPPHPRRGVGDRPRGGAEQRVVIDLVAVVRQGVVNLRRRGRLGGRAERHRDEQGGQRGNTQVAKRP